MQIPAQWRQLGWVVRQTTSKKSTAFKVYDTVYDSDSADAKVVGYVCALCMKDCVGNEYSSVPDMVDVRNPNTSNMKGHIRRKHQAAFSSVFGTHIWFVVVLLVFI